MKIKKAWIEYEDEDGKSYLAPATDEALAELRAKPKPEFNSQKIIINYSEVA